LQELKFEDDDDEENFVDVKEEEEEEKPLSDMIGRVGHLTAEPMSSVDCKIEPASTVGRTSSWIHRDNTSRMFQFCAHVDILSN